MSSGDETNTGDADGYEDDFEDDVVAHIQKLSKQNATDIKPSPVINYLQSDNFDNFIDSASHISTPPRTKHAKAPLASANSEKMEDYLFSAPTTPQIPKQNRKQLVKPAGGGESPSLISSNRDSFRDSLNGSGR